MQRKSSLFNSEKTTEMQNQNLETWGYICPLFEGIKILGALSMVGTKKAPTSLVTDPDGQCCIFRVKGLAWKTQESILLLCRQFSHQMHTSPIRFHALLLLLCIYSLYFVRLTTQSWYKSGLRAHLSKKMEKQYFMFTMLLLCAEISQEKWGTSIQGCHEPVLANQTHCVQHTMLGALHALSTGNHRQVAESVGDTFRC